MKNTIQAVYVGVLWCLAHSAGAVDAPTPPVQAVTERPWADRTQPANPVRSNIDAAPRGSADNGKWDDPALQAYRAQFENGTTARDMEAFIAKYQDADPEKRVPRAKIRMRTFAAFEAARSAYRCRQARILHHRILGYSVALPFNYDACVQEWAAQSANPQSVYLVGVRLEGEAEAAIARTLFRIILDRFPQHPLAQKAADHLARIDRIEADKTAFGNTLAVCPKDLGHIRSRMVFSELRNNPSFAEPIDGVIYKAGGLDAAIAELERLIRNNQQSLSLASATMQQYQTADSHDAMTFRCAKPEGNFCTANYYYHLLKEGEYYYAELLNGLRCRKTGEMLHAPYKPAPIGRPAPITRRAAAKTP